MTISFLIDPKSGVPYYRQIIDQVKSAMATEEIGPGDRLPTVRLGKILGDVEGLNTGFFTQQAYKHRGKNIIKTVSILNEMFQVGIRLVRKNTL